MYASYGLKEFHRVTTFSLPFSALFGLRAALVRTAGRCYQCAQNSTAVYDSSSRENDFNWLTMVWQCMEHLIRRDGWI